MMKWFLKYFVPNEKNDYMPYVLRVKSMVRILSVVLFLEIVFLVQILFILPNTNYFASILPAVVIDLTNKERADIAKPALIKNDFLQEAAKMKAEDMASRGYFSHDSPDGTEPWDWIKKTGYSFSYAGENLAINFFDSKDVVEAWMNSTTHRANMLDGHFTEIGIGTARGTYKGREALFVVQFFATPSSSSKTEVSAVSSAEASSVSGSGQEIAGVSARASESSFHTSRYSSLFEKVFSSPKGMNLYILLTLLTIIVLGFVLNVFVKMRIQHPPLIVNGAIMLMVIGSLLAINQYIAFVPTEIF